MGFFVRGPYHGEEMPFLHHVMIVWFPAPILSERGVSRQLTCPVSTPGTDPTWSRCVVLAACRRGRGAGALLETLAAGLAGGAGPWLSFRFGVGLVLARKEARPPSSAFRETSRTRVP